jgi:hypothetical protein
MRADSLLNYTISTVCQTVYLVERESPSFPGVYFPMLGFASELAAQTWIETHPVEAPHCQITTIPFFNNL